MKRFVSSLMLLGATAVPLAVAAQEAPQLQAKNRSLGGSLTPAEAPKTLMSKSRIASRTVSTIENGDGSYEGVWGLIPGSGVDASEWVQRFVLPQSSGTVTEAAVCFSSDNGGSFDFEFLIFSANGNRPGNELDRIGFRTPQLDALVVECLQLPEINFPTTTDRYFFGVQFSANDDLLVLADENSPEEQPSYVRAPGVTGFERLGGASTLSGFEAFRNLAVAINFDDGDGAGGPSGNTDPCVADAQTLCLNRDRFEIKVDFATPQGDSGAAGAVKLADDSGYVWFFDQNNVEAVFKVLDGCLINQNYWFFAGGLTNVAVDVTVRDSVTGFQQVYRNPQGTLFQPIEDTSAFPTCP
ncbi:MAG: hypothetical protein AAGA81_02650 [Acidobacteriota bacterium]